MMIILYFFFFLYFFNMLHLWCFLPMLNSHIFHLIVHITFSLVLIIFTKELPCLINNLRWSLLCPFNFLRLISDPILLIIFTRPYIKLIDWFTFSFKFTIYILLLSLRYRFATWYKNLIIHRFFLILVLLLLLFIIFFITLWNY